jgi:hypothetical protein
MITIGYLPVLPPTCFSLVKPSEQISDCNHFDINYIVAFYGCNYLLYNIECNGKTPNFKIKAVSCIFKHSKRVFGYV